MYGAKTKVLISCAVTTQLVCAFVFVYAKNKFFFMTRLMTRLKIFAKFPETTVAAGKSITLDKVPMIVFETGQMMN